MNLERGLIFLCCLLILGGMVLIPVTFAASVYFKVFFTESSVMQSKEKLDYLSEGWVIFSQNCLIYLYINL